VPLPLIDVLVLEGSKMHDIINKVPELMEKKNPVFSTSFTPNCD
jgi:hypothetical protein